jgi:hypothetical protein
VLRWKVPPSEGFREVAKLFNNKKMKSIIKLIAVVFLFSSCEKVVELDLSNNVEKLVVEASITNEVGPHFIKLTKSVNFNEISTYPPVSNAKVVISDNAGQKDTLTYTKDGLYKTNKLKGIEGRTYYLNIVFDGKTYTAESTMPQAVGLADLKIISFNAAGSDRNAILPLFKDPIGKGNNYRFLQRINGKLDGGYYITNDNLGNGEMNQKPISSRDIDLKKGDVVQIEMQCVSLDTYNYFYALGSQAGGGPGGSSAPANPPNNIKGGDALGFFSAHTFQKREIIIP